ncbi:MAG: hypothetical protein ACLTAI_10130 [Thomasclavelia sp.]
MSGKDDELRAKRLAKSAFEDKDIDAVFCIREADVEQRDYWI